MIEAVLFDIDGTLVDSVHAHSKVFADAFAERGKPIPEPTIARLIGLAGPDLLPHFLTEEEINAFGEELLDRKKKIWNERYLGEIVPVPGVRDLLQTLEEMGYKLAIGSSASEDELGTLKRLGGITDLLPVMVNSEDVENTKPSPDVWLAASGKLRVTPDVCVAVGDTPYDLKAARRAGCRAIGVTTGVWNRDELREAGAEEVYADARDFLNRLPSSALLGTAPTASRELP